MGFEPCKTLFGSKPIAPSTKQGIADVRHRGNRGPRGQARRAPKGHGAPHGRRHRPPRAGRGRLPRTPRPRPSPSRRLSIVGLADGRQPICNEDGSVSVVFNGELFDYPEKKAEPGSQGPPLPHPLRHRAHPAPLGGPRRRHVRAPARPVRRLPVGSEAECLILARDRFGICPLYWTIRSDGDGDWLLVRLRDQGAARLGHGAGQGRPARHQPPVHLLRPAGAGDLLRGHPACCCRATT